MATVLKPPDPSIEAVRNALAEYIDSENGARKARHNHTHTCMRRRGAGACAVPFMNVRVRS